MPEEGPEVDPDAPRSEDFVHDAEVIDDVFGLSTKYLFVLLPKVGAGGGGAHRVDEEARQYGIPMACLWLVLVVVVGSVYLLKVTCRKKGSLASGTA